MLTKDLKGRSSKLIRGALNKTQFREQSESFFLTSGWIDYSFSDFLKNNTEISPLTCLMKTAITIQTRKYSPWVRVYVWPAKKLAMKIKQ